MNGFHFLRRAFRMIVGHFGRLGWWIVGLAVALCTMAAHTQATPITFAFDAQVTMVSIFPPFQLPFPVVLGDTIHGRFSFVPYPDGNFGIQQLPLRIDVGGTTLLSSPYEIAMELNQSPPDENGSGNVLDPGAFTDDITIECPLAGCSPHTVPGSPTTNWSVFMQFIGPSPTLSNHLNLTGDLQVWDSLPLRGLVLNLSTQQGGVRVDALIGSLKATPEPPSLVLAALAMFLFLMHSINKRGDRHNIRTIPTHVWSFRHERTDCDTFETI